MIVNPFTRQVVINHPGHPDQGVHDPTKGSGDSSSGNPESWWNTREKLPESDPDLAPKLSGNAQARQAWKDTRATDKIMNQWLQNPSPELHEQMVSGFTKAVNHHFYAAKKLSTGFLSKTKAKNHLAIAVFYSQKLEAIKKAGPRNLGTEDPDYVANALTRQVLVTNARAVLGRDGDFGSAPRSPRPKLSKKLLKKSTKKGRVG